MNRVTVKFGANTLAISAVGQTVGTVRNNYAAPLGMSGDEQCRLNNQAVVGSDYILQNGDVIEFVKASGEKG